MTSSTQALEALVTAHTAPENVPASCTEEMASYRASATELLTSMGGHCAGLDHCMQGMGLSRAVTDLVTELDAHAANGCAAANLTSELARHREVMLGHCMRLRTGAGSMSGMGMRGDRCR